jgi:hypothetical protein
MGAGDTGRFDYLTHHEAGHAAVAFHFGLRLEWVSVDKGNDRGWVTTEQGTPLQRVLIALAGGRAELHLDGSQVGNRWAAAQDWGIATDVIEGCLRERFACHPDNQIAKMVNRVEEMAARRCALIVRERWQAIQRLVAVLAERRELTGEEVETVLAGEDI